MKRSPKKVLYLLLVLALLAGLGWFLNTIFGNPVSGMLAKKAGQTHLDQNYPGKSLFIDRTGYDFKTGNYYAVVKSSESEDTYFSIYVNAWGRILSNTYDDAASGFNTYLRLDTAYRELTDTLLESSDFPYSRHIVYGTLECVSQADAGRDDAAPYALIMEELILDHPYDVSQLGAEAGHIIAYLNVEEVTADNAAAILLDIRRLMDERDLPFHAISLTLRVPPADVPDLDSPKPIELRHFLYDDIYEEDLVNRVENTWAETTAYYARQDAKR